MRTTRLLSTALLLALTTSLGCAFGEMRWSDPLDRELSLEDAQHRYTVLMRWSHFEKAANYVHPDVRDEFIASAPAFRDLRFTEYESDPVELDEARASATIEVTYYVYTPTSPMETSVTETQEWTRESGNNWFVKSSFSGLQEILALNQ